MDSKHIFFFIAVAWVWCTPVSAADAENFGINRLRCQNISNPIGIDVLNPVLSWEFNTTRKGFKQRAYRILVSDNLLEVSKMVGNQWDSGKVNSPQSIQLTYKGNPLQPAQSYYWRVMVWDDKGIAKWSDIATWSTGLIKTADWKGAKWIAAETMPRALTIVPALHGKGEAGNLPKVNVLPLFRKKINLKNTVRKAYMFMTGLGHFELSLNGKKVGDHFLDAGWTKYDKEALYVTFDLTASLQKGGNTIGVMLGNGFYHIPAERYRKLTGTFGYPKMICRLLVEYKDGSTEDFVSDETWKTTAGPITFSSIYGGESYDANLEKKGWGNIDFDDSDWKDVMVVNGPGRLMSQLAPPLKVMEKFKPVRVIQKNKGWLFDFGQNAAAIPFVTLKGKKGNAVKFIPAEVLDSSGMIQQKPSGSPSWFSYTLKGTEKESWAPRFSYYGFRYVYVEGAVPEGVSNPEHLPVIYGLESHHVRNSSETVGTFHCSNSLFNNIFQLIDWSVKSNMASVITDCPHREKLGWLEVPHLLGNSIRYNYDIANFYRKIVEDMSASQTTEGLVPNIAPEYVAFTPDFRDSPEWGSSSVIVPWYLYQWYGDRATLKEHYSMMKKYVHYLETKSKGHMVSHGLGDWFDIGPNGSGSGYSLNTPAGITGTAMYYYTLTIMKHTAALLGVHADAVYFSGLANEVKNAFNIKFFNKEKGFYGTNSQAANAMAIYMELVEPQFKEVVVTNLVNSIKSNGFRLTTGEVGYSYLIRVLEKEGYSDVIFSMNNRSDVPGYGYQLASGATTLMEDWEAKTSLGNNHCMLGHLMSWLYSGVGGIRQSSDSQAFKTIDINPEPVGDLKSAEVTYRSPHGLIKTAWKKEGLEFTLKIEIPANTTAKVFLPVDTGGSVTESGKAIENSKHVAFIGFLKNKSVFAVGSGKYQFTVKNKRT